MNIIIKKFSESKNDYTCILPENVFKNLGLSENIKYNINLGQLSGYSFFSPGEDTKNRMYIPEKLFNRLFLLDGLSLNIKMENDSLNLGPVVGIFINSKRFYAYEDGTADKHEMKAGREENCLSYYYSFEDVNWKDKIINGFTLEPGSDKWIKAWFPFPNVIYDRGTRFYEEQKQTVKELRQRFIDYPGIQLINSLNYLGKMKTYEKLSKYTEMCAFLPKTMKYTNFNDVIIMLKQNDFIFLKFTFGSEGKQVLSIEKLKNQYKLVHYDDGLKEEYVSSIEELRKIVEDFVEDRRFVIQKGIRLLKYKGQVFDMRVLISKDTKGEWRVIYNQSRIAKSDFTITNYCAGGNLDLYENIYPYLKSSYPDKKIPDYNMIGEAAILIARYLEKEFGAFGEFGMDMAIDVNGRTWFIEANTKPDKELIEGVDDLNEIPLQNIAIFEYARYLSSFN